MAYHTSAIITGSLHTRNIGDFELLKSFLKQHETHYNNVSLLGESSGNQDIDSRYPVISPPPLAIGYRFYYGMQGRRRTKAKILETFPNSSYHYVWLGGLFGSNSSHMKLRYKELKWALLFR
jgi:hypothetical protein